MSAGGWLSPAPRTTSSFSFEVTDIQETSNVPAPYALAKLLRESYWGNDYLADLAAKYGFDTVRDRFLKSRSGTAVTVKRGDFGEAVTVDYLREVEGYHVPVNKLRYKIGANQTLPGTDCVALKLSDDAFSEVVFVESKMRTSLDLSVAVSGSYQLKGDADKVTPDILTFMARRLRDTKDPLCPSFETYLFQRDTDVDKYLLMILHEANNWDERVLDNLEDEDIDLQPLRVYVARISDLKDLSDRAFATLGVGVIEDED